MTTLTLILAFLVGSADAGALKSRLESAPQVVWAGVDYSPAQFFVPETFDDPSERAYFSPQGSLGETIKRYDRQDQAWKDLTRDWNTLAQDLLLEKIEKVIEREIVTDLPDPAGQTRKSGPYFLSQYDYKVTPPQFTRDDVAGLVKKYRLRSRDGVGYAVIVERASSIEKQGCVWPTFFDVKSRDVIHTDRVCVKPGGNAFRAYWLKPVTSATKDIIKGLKKDEL